MTLHIETMSNPAAPPTESPRAALVRKLLLLVLLIIAAALGLIILFRRVWTAPPIWMVILGDAVMGLVAGFSARWVLRKQTGLLRFSSALAALVGGLALLGLLTGWQIGIGPLKFNRSSVDWFGLGQLSFGMGIALLALYAWQRPSRPIEPAPRPKPVKRPPRPKKQPKKQPPRATQARTSPRVLSRAVRPTPMVEAEQPVKPKCKRVDHRKSQLQLSNEEEHRCPYCLELIEPDDPRGIVECKVCHTLHHADCWAITGACQVPHYNA